MTPAAPPRPAELVTLPHSGLRVGEFFSMHFMAAAVPMAAGLILFGWRAVIAALLVCAGAAVGIAIWRRVGSRGQQVSYHQGIWLALLLSMMFPAHLAAGETLSGVQSPWLVLVAAGLVLAMFHWLLGGLGGGRIHPVLVTYLIFAALSADLMVPKYVLLPHHLVVGDLQQTKSIIVLAAEREPWANREKTTDQHAESSEAASIPLSRYTRGGDKTLRGLIPIQSLLRDELPPLEDLIVGGHPSPIGTGSAIGVIIGGLFLLYRGLIDFRIPLLIMIMEFASLLILPVPAALRTQSTWHWLVSRQPGVGWGTGITFVNYEMMASPVLFMAFFLATSPSIRPMSRRARLFFAVLVGAGSGALQLYLGLLMGYCLPVFGMTEAPRSLDSVAIGPYVALLLVSLLTPLMDRWFRARPVV